MKIHRLAFSTAKVGVISALLVFAYGFSGQVSKVAAAGCSWTGASSTLWADPTNWGAGCTGVGGVPGSGDSLTFPASPTTFTSHDDLAGSLTLSDITITGTGYNITAGSGNSLVLTNGVSITTGTATIAIDISFSGSQTVSAGSGSLDLSGAITLPVATTLFINSAGYVTLGGTVSGTGNITKMGSGSLDILGNNNYSGQTTVSAGFINVRSDNALGTTAGSTILANGATINVDGPGLNIPEPLVLNGGNGNVGAGAIRNFTGSNTLSGTINLNATGTYIQSETGLMLTMSGIIAEAGAGYTLNLVGIGTGSVVLTNTNVYTGATSLQGKNYINGSQTGSAANVTANTGVLAGSGSTGDVSVTQTNSGIMPGTVAGGPAVLNTGSVSMNGVSGQFMTFKINSNTVGSGYSQLNVTGTVSLNTGVALNVSGSYVPHKGDVFTLINNDGADAVVSNFTGLPEGGSVDLNGAPATISYAGGSGNDVTLTVQSSIPNVVLTSSANPSFSGENINLTATVSGNAGTPTGSVTFKDGINTIAVRPLNGSGQAVLSIASLGLGSHTITAIYGGDSNYGDGGTLAPVIQVVDPALAHTGVDAPLGLFALVSLLSLAGLVALHKQKLHLK